MNCTWYDPLQQIATDIMKIFTLLAILLPATNTDNFHSRKSVIYLVF